MDDDGDYGRYVRDYKAVPRGSSMLLNTGEIACGDLANIFATINERALAGGWVAHIIDALAVGNDVSIGAINAALIVVATRLHGVTFDEPVKGVHAMTLVKGTPSEISGAGFKIMSGPPPAPKKGSRHNPLNDAILALQPGQHIQVESGRMKLPAMYGRLNTIKKKHGGSKSLRCYETDAGTIVVTRSATLNAPPSA